MQIQKLITGKTLYLKKKKDFCLVVDGFVQIFIKLSKVDNKKWADDKVEVYKKKENHSNRKYQDYQLLIKRKYAAFMFSFFFVLLLLH